MDISSYIYIITAIGGWLTAQGLKILLSAKQEGVNWLDLITSGGMPSSHTSLVTSLTLVIGLMEGLTSVSFGLSLMVWGIVVYDSMGVRRATGENTRILQKITDHLKLGDQKQAYYLALGHSPLQVLGGVINGIIWGSLIFWILG